MVGDLHAALELLQRAVRLDPQSEFALYNLALAYSKAGRYPEAESAYRRHLALAAGSAEGYNGLSYVLTKLQRYEEADVMAQAALRLKPEFAEAHYNRGRALEGLGRPAEAAAEYKRVIRLSPSEEGVRRRLRAIEASEGGRDP
jgi:tetratricopeptide (TPR) repeat protein